MPSPAVVDRPVDQDLADPDRPWKVIVWNDSVNTVDYVIFVLQKLFNFSKAKATRLTLQVHHEGKSAVSNGPREHCEANVFRLHEYGLWATLEQDT